MHQELLQTFVIQLPFLGLLDAKIFDYRWIDINKESISNADLEKSTGTPVYTIPQAFHGQQHVDGFTELNRYVGFLAAA